MKSTFLKSALLTVCYLVFSQVSSAQIADALKGKEVFKNEDVVFHQIDNHTWVGTGHEMYNESIYLLEGNDKAVLIDAGTNIEDLDKIVGFITSKPVMLVATHVHPDHTGSAINCFPQIYINPADTIMMQLFMPNFSGEIRFMKDEEVIELGGRSILVVFTPAHTPGSTTFIDTKAGYGFSGDSFGSGNLLLSLTFSELVATCEKTGTLMERYNVGYFYPGHYFGENSETRQRIEDLITISKDVLSGKMKGEKNSSQMMGLDQVVSANGVRINYNEKSVM